MGKITLEREDVERILANPDADPGSRLIAACAKAMFIAHEHAEEAGSRELSIARKLLHMTTCVIYDAFDELCDPGAPS